ncbi:DNA methyltransferase [Brachybacterium sp. GPGPB12]|uniref:DNA methyltransferase n=1 Tax=Brachybacterium sp. GPGPB12 TaxID=3023517 RepID=UPI0031342D2F
MRTDWAEVFPASPNAVIMGNPPFLGHATRTAEQAQEPRGTCGGRKDIGRLDYVTGWYRKALDFFGDVPGRLVESRIVV